MFLLEIQTIVGCNMLDKLVELCKNDLVSTIVESESPKIMIPFCTSILSALVILPMMLKFNQWRKSHMMKKVRFKNIKRFETELKWIKLLQTPFPLGFNDNIYHEGNISKMPDFDVLTLSESRKRKSRSHGIRKKGNDKRKRCAALKLNISLNDLAVKLRIHGRHPMLSYLSSLPIAALRSLDTEANRFYDRNHQMYDAALLTRCYTQHALRPFIDSESNHIKSFIKIPFINKGIDFIDLPSIFQDKSVIQSIPAYFQNSEPPIICYKYNKPIRNTIFNFNKLVSDLDIHANTPKS